MEVERESNIPVDSIAKVYSVLDDKRRQIVTQAMYSPMTALMFVHYDEVRVLGEGTRDQLLNMMMVLFPALVEEGTPTGDGGTYFMGVSAELVCDMTRVLYEYGKDNYGWQEGYTSFIADVITRLHQEAHKEDD